jgi:cysteine desulfurase
VGVPLAACKDKKYSGCVYFDYNASTPVFPEVAEAMMPFLTSCFGNPTSPHVYGKPCREAINVARKHVQVLIGAASENEIIFCSCGSEADNRAIDVGVHNFKAKTGGAQIPHIVASSVEHPAISKYLASLQKQGLAEVSVVPVDREGRVNPEDVCFSANRFPCRGSQV